MVVWLTLFTIRESVHLELYGVGGLIAEPIHTFATPISHLRNQRITIENFGTLIYWVVSNGSRNYRHK